MNPLILLVLVAPVLSQIPPNRQLNLQQSQLQCTSLFNNQPNQCRAPGRIVEAWVAQRQSPGKCRVYSTFGFVDNYLWVRGGCGGTFVIVYDTNPANPNPPTNPQGCQQGQVNTFCFNTNPGATVCRVPLLVTRISYRQGFNTVPGTNTACRLNSGYGISQNQSAIWTNRGCQGTFDVSFDICEATTQIGCRSFTTSLQCGDGGFTFKECSIPVEITNVQLRQSVIQGSNPCVENVSYGRLPVGVWVAQGCRGSFTLSYRVCNNGYQAALLG